MWLLTPPNGNSTKKLLFHTVEEVTTYLRRYALMGGFQIEFVAVYEQTRSPLKEREDQIEVSGGRNVVPEEFPVPMSRVKERE